MGLDNEIRSGEYDNFEIAQEDADKEVKTLDEQKSVIEGYKNSLNNESVFAGPACESCIKEIDSLITNITLDAENFNTIKSYLDSALNNYLDADKKAEKYLDIKDGKVQVVDKPTTVVPTTAVYTNNKLNTDQVKFINTILPGALELYNKYGILPSLTLSQAALESKFGEGDSIFGVKASADWKGDKINAGTWEYSGGAYDTRADFRAYSSTSAAIEDYGKVIVNSFPKAAADTNYKDAVIDIQKGKYGKYATDPDYSSKLRSMIENYDLNQWDPK